LKRGLIAWDKNEIQPAVFERRIAKVREVMIRAELAAVVVYSELWRSNQGRYFANYMPYFNRAFLILPMSEQPILFCGLSPRVYSWIRSVTTIEDIRPAGNFSRPLFQLASERQWNRVGVVDLDQLPYDLHHAIRGSELEIVNVPGNAVFSAGNDETELAMRRAALSLTRPILEDEISKGAQGMDHDFVGRVEGRLRRAGVEDVIVLLANGDGPPAPAVGRTLQNHFSASLAVEYRGHWIRLSRPHGSAENLEACKQEFVRVLGNAGGQRPHAQIENLSGSYPFEATDEIATDSVFAMHIQVELNAQRVFYGDTCRCSASETEIL